MSFVIDGEEVLVNGEVYKFIKKHRDSSYNKASHWIISFIDEHAMANQSLSLAFTEVINKNNIIKQAYNVLKSKGSLQTVGTSKNGLDLKLGKFVKTTPALRHGYPADYIGNIHDKPSQNTLTNMFKNGSIDKNELSKISRGKKI